MQHEFDLVDEASSFHAPTKTTPIDLLLAQHQALRAKIERIGALMNGPDADALYYFGQHATAKNQNFPAELVEKMFDVQAAIAFLDAAFWSRTLQMTNVLDVMPQARRDAWHEQIKWPSGRKADPYTREKELPRIAEFNRENAHATVTELLNMRQTFLAERVDGIFRSLSRSHVTNKPEGFGMRMILSGALDGYGNPDYKQAGVINDLRAVIAKFMGREEPGYNATGSILTYALAQRRGEWVTIDGGALRIRCYLIGTAHLEVHPEMAWRLNAILANLYPLAIPEKFRQKPTKQASKNFPPLIDRPLPFLVLERLRHLCEAYEAAPNRRWNEDIRVRVRDCYEFKYGAPTDTLTVSETERVLESLGGAPVGDKNTAAGSWRQKQRWQFDYNPLEVIKEIIASGCIPDQKAHQFYPTPEDLARELVDAAEIGPEHDVLEPSAGHGGLADHLPKERTTCIEVAAMNAKVLEAKGHSVIRADFLAWAQATEKRFDRIVMNPPFSEGRAEAHTRAAATLLRPGGRLTAILPSGMRGKPIPGLDCSWSAPMSNRFPGVSIDVIILTATRPAA